MQKFLKKGFLLFSLILITTTAYAQDAASTAVLRQIKQTTDKILDRLNQSPTYVEAITKMAKSWVDTVSDDSNSDTLKSAQGVIDKHQTADEIGIANYFTAMQNQYDATQALSKIFLAGGNQNPEKATANSTNYLTLLGQPPLPVKNKDALTTEVQNYLQNISGASFLVKPADTSWKVDNESARTYRNFYNVISSIQSYDAYILGGLDKHSEVKMNVKKDNNSNQLTSMDVNTYLMLQASNQDWFTQIATEPLGYVLRQLLMYSSETYVQLSKLVAIQQQQVAAQAMANTLAIMQSTSYTGTIIAQKACQQSGKSPQSCAGF
ncbi:hypothetical protein AYO45_02420 [Gammaproteobacteria bacterium SCGC AG-212-F23]|nr:hypothetical protein AYO45_02420 [Gammaproteobacteria bacterium SCGC AG-212-F23]